MTWGFTLNVAFWQIPERQLNASICPSTDREAQRQEREEDNSDYCLVEHSQTFFANSWSNEWAVINYSHAFCDCFPQIFQHISLLAGMQQWLAFVITIIFTSRQILKDILYQLEKKKKGGLICPVEGVPFEFLISDTFIKSPSNNPCMKNIYRNYSTKKIQVIACESGK